MKFSGRTQAQIESSRKQRSLRPFVPAPHKCPDCGVECNCKFGRADPDDCGHVCEEGKSM